MNKQQEFLLKLKDPTEYGVLKAMDMIVEYYSFIDGTRTYELNHETTKENGWDRQWHVDIYVDCESPDPRFQSLSQWDGESDEFTHVIERILREHITLTRLKVSEYYFDSQKFAAVFHTR